MQCIGEQILNVCLIGQGEEKVINQYIQEEEKELSSVQTSFKAEVTWQRLALGGVKTAAMYRVLDPLEVTLYDLSMATYGTIVGAIQKSKEYVLQFIEFIKSFTKASYDKFFATIRWFYESSSGLVAFFGKVKQYFVNLAESIMAMTVYLRDRFIEAIKETAVKIIEVGHRGMIAVDRPTHMHLQPFLHIASLLIDQVALRAQMTLEIAEILYDFVTKTVLTPKLIPPFAKALYQERFPAGDIFHKEWIEPLRSITAFLKETAKSLFSSFDEAFKKYIMVPIANVVDVLLKRFIPIFSLPFPIIEFKGRPSKRHVQLNSSTFAEKASRWLIAYHYYLAKTLQVNSTP
jgi:hypothetical protein